MANSIVDEREREREMYIYIGERQGGECEGDLSLPVLTAAIDPNDFF